jgi:hypothetical protein
MAGDAIEIRLNGEYWGAVGMCRAVSNSKSGKRWGKTFCVFWRARRPI